MLGGYMNMGVQGIKAAFVSIVAVGTIGGGNLLLGSIDDNDILGTDPSNSVIIANGTIPDATSDGMIFIGAKDASNDTTSTLSVYTERQIVAGSSDSTSDAYLEVWINRTPYKLLLKGY